MEVMASAGPRVQLLLGRVQLQEQRIINQTRRLDAVTASLALARKQLEPVTEHLTALGDGGMSDPGLDAETRRLRQWELETTKKEWAKASADVRRLEMEETFLTGDLASEQNRWTDFNQKLEELERALARR